MKDIDNVKIIFTAAFAAVTGWLGVLAWPFYFLLLTNLIDYVTGIMAAARRGEKVNSSIGIWGIAKKVCMWLLVLVGYIIDFIITEMSHTVHIDIGVSNVFALVVIFWLMANELISILENINDVGVDYPAPLMKILELVKDKTTDSIEIPKEE